MRNLLMLTGTVLMLARIGLAATSLSVSQYGITWTFDTPHEVGQFANGDWWVQGPVTITSITPDYDGTSNGWEANPSTPGKQGLDGHWQTISTGTFDASLVPALPYVAQPGVSILKAISIPGGGRPCLKTAAVLTVVGAIPPDRGATVLRPPYFGTEKPYYSINSIDLSVLPQLVPVPLTRYWALTLDTLVDEFKRVQIDYISDSPGQFIRPTDNMPAYGGNIAYRNAEAALRFMLGMESAAEKKAALIHYVQYGIDLYHMMKSGQNWWGAGGHDDGRKLPMAFTAVLLNNQAMKDMVRNSGLYAFQENRDAVFSAKADNGNGKFLFGQTIANPEEHYWQVMPYDNYGGSKTDQDPYGYIEGGFCPGVGYDNCCVVPQAKGTTLAVRLLPELDSIWNYRELLGWIDMRVSFGVWTQPDPCAPYKGTWRGTGARNGTPCNSAVDGTINTTGGDTCRGEENLGKTFGPDPLHPGDCIRDTDPSDGIGRFPQLHGSQRADWSTPFINAMWKFYRSTMPTPAPYSGTPADIPGLIQAENFDQGGAELAYYDEDTINRGGVYRTNVGVDIETIPDGGYALGYVRAGEWTAYTVNVAAAGNYSMDLRVASAGDGGQMHLEFNGNDKTGAITVPNTGGWAMFQTVTIPNVALNAGRQIMWAMFDVVGSKDGGVANVDYFNFRANPGISDRFSSGNTAGIPVDVGPNPTRNWVTFVLPENSGANARVKIFSRDGGLVTTGMPRPQENNYIWDGKDNQGHRVKPGVYVYTVTVDSRQATGRLMVLPQGRTGR